MSSLLSLLLFASVATLAAARMYPLEHAEIHFEYFMQQHGKQYADENEKQTRFQIFKDNLEKVNRMNEQSDVFGITRFMDMTSEEFINAFTGLSVPSNLTVDGCTDIDDSQVPNINAPDSFDWREHNAVTPVKFQGKCGRCYAFSAVGNIEGQYAIKHKQQLDLSEQQIIDCDQSSLGCYGGLITNAFMSIIQQGGIENEATYPYVGRQTNCHFSPSRAALRLTGCNSYNVASQEKLKQIVYSVGPISVGLRASNFQLYHGGVMSDTLCNVGKINHGVLLVGYGTENGVPYWLIKNSWGETFGESGYIKIQRGEGAASCGMMNNSLMYSSIVL